MAMSKLQTASNRYAHVEKLTFPNLRCGPFRFEAHRLTGAHSCRPQGQNFPPRPMGLFPSRNSHTPFRNETFTSLKITRETTTRTPCCFRARGRCRERVHHGRPTAAAASSFQGRGETGSQTSQPHRWGFFRCVVKSCASKVPQTRARHVQTDSARFALCGQMRGR